MLAPMLVVTFKKPQRLPCREKDLLTTELDRFAESDPRWRNLIEMAAAPLSPGGRDTLGVALSGLQTGPAPKLLSYDFEPDEEERIAREAGYMDPRLLAGLGMLSAERLGLARREVAAIRGIVTAIHRLLRVAKTRP